MEILPVKNVLRRLFNPKWTKHLFWLFLASLLIAFLMNPASFDKELILSQFRLEVPRAFMPLMDDLKAIHQAGYLSHTKAWFAWITLTSLIACWFFGAAAHRFHHRQKLFGYKELWPQLIGFILLLGLVSAGFSIAYLWNWFSGEAWTNPSAHEGVFMYFYSVSWFKYFSWALGVIFIFFCWFDLFKHLIYAINPIRYILILSLIFFGILFITGQGRQILDIQMSVFLTAEGFWNKLGLVFLTYMVVLFGLMMYMWWQISYIYSYYRLELSSNKKNSAFNYKYNPFIVRIIEELARNMLPAAISFILGLYYSINFWPNGWPVFIVFYLVFLAFFGGGIGTVYKLIQFAKAYPDPFDFYKLDGFDRKKAEKVFRALNELEKTSKTAITTNRKTMAIFFGSLQAIPVLYLIYPDCFWLSEKLGSFAIVMLSLGTFMFLLFNEFHWRKKLQLPVALLLVAMIAVNSFFNNNHRVRTLDETVFERPTVEEDFQAWMGEMVNDTLDSVAVADKPIPVFLVASEGGGIRAAFWTAGVLKVLTEEVEGFHEHLYALSGASGGTLGNSFYNTVMIDPWFNADSDTARLNCLYPILRKDYLTHLLSGFLFGDMLQNFPVFPGPVLGSRETPGKQLGERLRGGDRFECI